ncbi:MAG TPA: TetR/AcrR family transcriptional regulator [Bryobacteraceae bacterium]|nr:TetR/AcrR family transcriptional regulator [Bryobacteraceae bacterium]
MEKKTQSVRRDYGTTGRPREFDTDAALEKAMRLFWAKGYEGTSVADLTETLGISRPSLYAAFGDKQSLFRAALERYAAGPAGYVAAALAQSTAREVAEHLLRGAADLQASLRHPGGCLLVNGAIACGDDAAPIRQTLIAHRAAGVALLRRRFEQAKAQNDLPEDSDPAALARFLAAVVYGMAVLASSGASRTELEQVTRTAIKAWPATT